MKTDRRLVSSPVRGYPSQENLIPGGTGHRMANSARVHAAIVSGLWLAAVALCATQSVTAGPDAIRCADCALTGQKPAPPDFDMRQVGFIAQPRPAFLVDRTVQVDIIARVLVPSPLVLEVLDFQDRLVDKNDVVLAKDVRVGQHPATCGVVRVDAVDLKSERTLSTVRFNDLIAARWIYKRNERKPADFFAATLVLTDVRGISASTPYFHGTPPHESCANRSGRLVIHHGPVVDLVTVFNDGSIHYRNALSHVFSREKLSPTELADLLKAFGSANFDQIPGSVPASGSAEQSTLTLLGARYQNVSIEGREAALASLVRRMDDLAARATSHTQFVLTAGKKTKITILDWPYPQIGLADFRDVRNRGDAAAMQERLSDDFLKKLPLTRPASGFDQDPNKYAYFLQAGKLFRVSGHPVCRADEPNCRTFRSLDVAEVQTARAALEATRLDYRIPGSLLGARSSGYLWSADMGVKLAAVPPDGIVISKDEYERHKPVYFEILKAKASGLNFIEDGFLYEPVRLCQSGAGSVADCDSSLR